MEIHIEQIKPHRKWMNIVHIIKVSLLLIKFGVTIVYIMEEFKCIREKFKSTNWI